jgi:hypothetical protein
MSWENLYLVAGQQPLFFAAVAEHGAVAVPAFRLLLVDQLLWLTVRVADCCAGTDIAGLHVSSPRGRA